MKAMLWTRDPDIKVHGANMVPIWGRQNPGGPHVGPMNFAIWGVFEIYLIMPQPGRSWQDSLSFLSYFPHVSHQAIEL